MCEDQKKETARRLDELMYLTLFCREEEGTEPSKDVKYRRQQRRGYPPVTPNACAKDAVVSQLFDQAWGEVCTCTCMTLIFISCGAHENHLYMFLLLYLFVLNSLQYIYYFKDITLPAKDMYEFYFER